MTGTWTLVRFMLRRDRIKLPLWTAGLALYVLYVGSAVPQIASTPEELSATVAALFSSPMARMWVGPAYGMDAVTYERFFAAGYLLYLYALGALMTLLLVTRHTRGEEQSGRAELIRASVVGRHANLTAAFIVGVLANVVGGLVVAGAAVGVGFATGGSLLVGASLIAFGLVFAGVTAVTAQLTESSRSAAGLAGAVLGVAFLVRALGDMVAVGGSTLSWFSPLGWVLQTAPYVLDRWWPLLLCAGLAVLLGVVAYTLQARRDFGAGILRARRGRVAARPGLGTPLGLAWRLQRGGFIAWGCVIVLFALVDGLFGQALLDAAADMPPVLAEMFGGAEGMADGYLAFLAEFSGYLAVAYVVFAAGGLLVEEQRGRAGLILATPTSRTAWAGSHLAVIAVNVVLILLAAGAVAGVAFGAVTGQWSAVGTSVLGHLNLVTAVLVVLGFVAVLQGWLPRWLTLLGWLLVGVIIFAGLFGQLLNLPAWVVDVSPLRHPAQIPVEQFAVVPVLVLAGIAGIGVAVGAIGLRRRQVLS